MEVGRYPAGIVGASPTLDCAELLVITELEEDTNTELPHLVTTMDKDGTMSKVVLTTGNDFKSSVNVAKSILFDIES